MPWDGTQLCVAALGEGGEVQQTQCVAGGADVAIVGALWARDGRLVYSTDITGWWNLEAWDPQNGSCTTLTHWQDSDVGVPPWRFGATRMVELTHSVNSATASTSSTATQTSTFAFIATTHARDRAYLLAADGASQLIDTPYSTIGALCAGADGELLLQGQAPDALPSITAIDCRCENFSNSFIKSPDTLPIGKQWLSSPEPIEFCVGSRQSHAFFYPPRGHGLSGLAGELPPLIVMGHGGPTGHSHDGLKLAIQFWTSRGFAVVDVNYGGSTGFGRDYRRLLDRQWGVVDVEDCIAAAGHLANTSRVDAHRMVIRGGSAGGLTVLRALQTSDVFSAGTSLYGVADLESLVADTHKFESRYLDGLIGHYPHDLAIYQARSPIHHVEELNCSLLVLQGSEDEVVPPSQSEAIVRAVAAKGLPHAYIEFSGEQHGFRRARRSKRVSK